MGIHPYHNAICSEEHNVGPILFIMKRIKLVMGFCSSAHFMIVLSI